MKLSLTEYILREADARFKNIAVLWSGGKDSTALLHIIAAEFNEFPFTVIHLDNGKEFPETYKYMNEIKRMIPFRFITQYIKEKHDTITGLTCCGHNKTQALQSIIKKDQFDAIIVSIRWDEHGIRGMERYFSPRDKEFRWNIYNPDKGTYGEALQDPEFVHWGITVSDFGEHCDHVRIHPLLHWTEIDVWKFIKKNKLPVNDLYFSKNRMRFRSIGCMKCSLPIKSNAVTVGEIIHELEATQHKERNGRIQDKELAMQRLRSLGYF